MADSNCIIVHEQVVVPDDVVVEEMVALPGEKGDKGDPFTYDDFTPEQIAELQRPATEAAKVANEAAEKANKAVTDIKVLGVTLTAEEAKRESAESGRTSAESERAEAEALRETSFSQMQTTLEGLITDTRTATSNANTAAGNAENAATEATEDGTETPPVPMDYGETVNGLIRRKYTLSEELAILRQRDTKAEEFESYNAYAESCKEEARLLIEKQKH